MINPNSPWFGWIDPNNKFIKCYQLHHIEALLKEYPNIKSAEDLYEQAYSDGWIRIHYRTWQHLNGELCLTTKYEERIKEVLNTIFRDFLSIGRKTIIIVFGEEHKFFANNQEDTSKFPKKELIWDYLG
jgi:hypothetical protein